MLNQSTTQLHRLFAAADTLLAAMGSPAGADALVEMHMGDHDQEQGLPTDAFTQDELLEAMALLMRMGFTSANPARD
jgi:hypothetical protein